MARGGTTPANPRGNREQRGACFFDASRPVKHHGLGNPLIGGDDGTEHDEWHAKQRRIDGIARAVHGPVFTVQ